jgi:phage terminase large subunit-like protein
LSDLGITSEQLTSRRVQRAQGKQRAQDVIDFIETLTIPSGSGQGERFKLMPWQRKFIEHVYGPNDRKGNRLVRRAILSTARKNGKTALTAALALTHLVGPQAILHGEIYSAANDRDQAGIVFKFAKQMVELEPELRDVCDIVPSTKTIIGRPTGSVYRAISHEAGTKHGFLPSMIIYDELAQAKSRALYDVLDTSFGGRDEPLFVVISTQSNDPEHILSKLIDDGLSGADPSIVCELHCADEGCDLDDEKQWKEANPALGVFRNREDLAAAMRKAKRLPSEESKTRNLFLNQRVSQYSTLLGRAEWMAHAGNVEYSDKEELYLALDLSATRDLTALVAGTASEPCRVRAYFWKPGDMLAEHSARDFGAQSTRYLDWVREGHLRAPAGRSIDPNAVALVIAELYARYKIKGLAYDRWRIDDLLREFDRIGLAAFKDDGKAESLTKTGLRLVPWGQGFRDMGPAVDALEHAIDGKRFIHCNSPVLNWNIANATVATDPAGNRKLDKEKSHFRIDGAVALAMMMGLRARDRSRKPIIDVTALIM